MSEATTREMIELRISYDFRNYPTIDDVAHAAAGRESDFSGTAVRAGWRELGWMCESEIEAARMSKSLKAVGLSVSRAVRNIEVENHHG